MKKALLAVALTLTFPPVFAEKKTPTYDVAQFDIAGMKLGMTEQEIKAAIKTSLEMSDGDVTKEEEKKDKEIQWKKGNHKVKVHFIPDAWHDKMNVLVADRIEYGLPYTEENVKMLKDSAVQKYGVPSSDSIGSIRWCTSTASWDICRNGKDAELNLYYDYTVGILHLALDDARYFNAIRKAIDKTKTEKPKI